MTRDGIQIVLNVDQEGHLTPDNPNGWAGMYYLKVNKLINQDLTDRGLMFHEDRDHKHTVAHCWRCHERLFFNPQKAWYVNVQKLKPVMEKTNEQVSWYPSHFKHGRYLKSMQGAPDWCISRSRYWGSPVPVWEHTHADGEIERFVPGSIAELEEASGVKIADLHKPEIDEVTVPSKRDASIKLKRVPEVLDSWIEAGSATFAERHFPFDKTVKLDEILPPDFITEYTGQIRAWFYVLHVISAAIYQRPAFKHVMVSGVMMGTDGRKMSKNYKNYPDPREAIEMYGADALRLYLLSSTITNAEDANMSETDWRDQLRKFIIPLLNIWNFAKMYAEVDGHKLQAASNELQAASTNVLDKWLISLLHTTIAKVTASLETFDTMTTVATLTSFVDDWSKWYVRRSRDRAGSGELTADTVAFYETTQYVFEQFLRLIAPIVPFHSDYLYRELTGRDSVHLELWPTADKSLIHTELESNTAITRRVCEAGHQIRKANNWKVRMPLRKIEVAIDEDYSTIKDNLWQVVLDELNVKNIVINGKQSYPKAECVVTDEQLAYEGKVRDIIREVQALRKDAKIAIGQSVKLQVPHEYEQYSEEIKKQARISEIMVGDTLSLIS
jgi:isoleucyl-tRNA synthetase